MEPEVLNSRWTALAVIALALIGAGCREPLPVTPPAIRLSFPVPEGVEPESLDAAISPDEMRVVFVATSRGLTQLWRRALDAEQAEPLPDTEGARFPAWKRTGNAVSFFSGGWLRGISMADGSIVDLAKAPSPAGATWLPDGSLLFAGAASAPLQRVLDGRVTNATTLAAGDTRHEFPVAGGPSGDFVYVAVRSDGRRVVRLVAGGSEHDLTTTSGHAALAGDALLHVQDGVLLAYRVDTGTFRLRGRGIPVALDVGVSEAGHGVFAATHRLLLYSRASVRAREVIWLDNAGVRIASIGDVGDHWQVRLSPDDRLAAVTTLDPLLRTLDIYVMPTSGVGDTERLTLSLSAETAPVWSPDGARVLFRSLHEGIPGLFARRPRAKDADEVILESPLDETPTDWGSNGQILFHAGTRRGQDVFRLNPRDATYEPAAQTAFNETDGRWSPDGRWIAHVSDESGQPDVYVQDRGGSRQRISFGGGTRPRWSGDSRTLYFLRGTQVLRAALDGKGLRFGSAQPAFDVPGISDFDTAHRTDRFVVIRAIESSPPLPVHVVLNWTSILGGER